MQTGLLDEIARRLGIFSVDDLSRQTDLLRKPGFKLKLKRGVMPEEVIKAMRLDKKVRDGRVYMALPE